MGPPTLTCPVPVTSSTSAVNGPVSYPAPTLIGGSPPVTVVCNPASGTSFPLGKTIVSCSAADAVGRAAVCSFDVNVQLSSILRGTKFLAFGDSITSGEVGETSAALFYDPFKAYPGVLLQLLQSRYQTQTITVQNAGEYGNSAIADQDRLKDLVESTRPDALLLLEGVNDLNADGFAAVPRVRDALRADVIRAKNAGVKLVFLSTLTPENYGGGFAVEQMNFEIRAVAAEQGAILVDNYTAFVGRPELLGVDGIHPTTAGHHVMAETFFAAIIANFEQPASATPAAVRRP